MIAAGSPIHATAVGSRVSEGGPMRIARIPATLPFEEIVARVRDVDPDMMMGYPSVLLRLAAEQTAGRLDLHPRALTSTSENLRPEVRAQLEARLRRAGRRPLRLDGGARRRQRTGGRSR